MLGEGYARAAAGLDTHVRSAISRWRDGLIGAAAADALLSISPGADGVIALLRPPAGEVIARLAAGGTFTLRPRVGALAGAAPPAPGVLDTDQDPTGLAVTARQLTLRPGPDDPGGREGALYLAAGALSWAGEDQVRRASPLLLVPVRLTAAGDGDLPVLAPAADGPLVNPALARELARFGVTLPPVRTVDEVALARLLETAVEAAAARDGWRVTGTLLLSWLPFPSGATYRDLLDHEDLAAAHQAVRALAAGGRPGADRGLSRPAATPEIGSWTAPDVGPLILAADSPQRACVATALAGRPLVIEGAGGTGKRQTIANMAGALLHAGKTVLLVAPDPAAAGTLSGRLAGAGLGPCLLELATRPVTPADVPAELAAALDAPPARPPAPPGGLDAIRQELGQLGACTGAMKRPRPPLGYSLHDVLGMIGSMRDVPAAPAGGPPPASLTATLFAEVRRAAAALAAAWRPAAEGRSFPWRGVIAQGSQDDRLYQAASALEELAGMVRLNQALADVTGLTRPSGAPALAALLDHLWGWPEGMPDEWLTVDTLDAVQVAVTQLAAALTAIGARESQAAQAAGGDWHAIPDPAGLPAADTRALAALTPACADPAGLTAGQISGLARSFSATAGLLEKRLDTLASLASMLGLPPPVSFSDAADLLTLAHLAEEPDRPERSWLSVPGQQAAYEAGRTLFEAHRALATAAAAATVYYTPDVLQHDVAALAERFGHDHHRFSKLSGDYRADRRAVASFTREGVAPEAALEQLALAVAWQHAARGLAAAEARHGALLGSYYAGRATDFDRLGRALTHAATAVRSARGHDLSRAAEHIARDAVPKPVITATAAEIRQDLAGWQAALAPAPAVAPRPELMSGGITAAAEWLRAHLRPLQAASSFTEQVSETAGRPLTFGQARQLVSLREAAEAAHAELTSRDAVFTDLCGRLYAGTRTDIAALTAALDWARALRSMITGGEGPLSPAHLKAAESAVPTAGLADAAAAWQHACTELAGAFGPERRRDLAAELDDYEDGTAALEAMFNDTTGREEWHAYQSALAALAAHGLAEAVGFCAAQQVPAARVAQVIECSVLAGWADYQLRTAPDLAALRAAGHAALVRDYQDVDRALRAAAAGDIIRACSARRPHGSSETDLIRREAVKAGAGDGTGTGRPAAGGTAEPPLPVDQLLERASRTVQALKPCFVMTPRAVSRYLPAELHFDVVIVSDAGAVTLAEAAACLYRGTTAVLVTGPARDAGPGSRPAAAPVPELAVASGAFEHVTLAWRYAPGE